jgi:predicted DNA-binding transcriptional regulator AlpA
MSVGCNEMSINTTSSPTLKLEQKLLVPATEAALMLSMGRSTFWAAVRDKKLPQPVHIGGLTRWRVADLQACIHAA